MRQIRFRFDPEKMVATLTFLAQRVPDLDAMKSVKLLYFADKAHLLRYGRPIVGDAYYGLEHGPVPTATYELIKQVFGNAVAAESAETAELLAEYLDVDRSGQLPRFIARRPPDMDQLSASDIEVLEETLSELGGKTAVELSALAHKQPEIQYADEQRAAQNRGSVPIPFHLFFDPHKHKTLLAAVESSQEERDFAESLHW